MTESKRGELAAAVVDELERRGLVDGSLLLETLRAREDVQNVDAFLRRVERMIIASQRRAVREEGGR